MKVCRGVSRTPADRPRSDNAILFGDGARYRGNKKALAGEKIRKRFFCLDQRLINLSTIINRVPLGVKLLCYEIGVN